MEVPSLVGILSERIPSKKVIYYTRTGEKCQGKCAACRKLMKCPLILAIELSPSTIGYSVHQNLDLRRLFDAVLYDRYGEGYENPRSYFKGRFWRNPLD